MKTTKLEASAATAVATKDKGGRKSRRKLILFLLLVLFILAPFLIVELINSTQEPRIFTSVQTISPRPVAIIFGAGLNRNGTPSPILADRIEAGIALFRAGKVQNLLMTGDGDGNSEPTAMRDYAVKRGIPRNAVTIDTEGLRTYDSCYRAYYTYNVRQAVLVTQAYHLPRALYTCNGLGIDAVGYKAGQDEYPNQQFYNQREFLATLVAWAEVTITRPKLS